MKIRSSAHRIFDPNSPIQTLDKSFANGQTDARALVLGLVMRSLEYAKDLITKPWFNTDPVVPDRKRPSIVGGFARHVNFGDAVAVLDRVADQILKELRELHWICIDGR